MKPHIHANNIGDKIIALQHPSETLHQFMHRCDELLLQELYAPVPPPPAEVQVDQPCPDCGGFGYVLAGAQKFVCQTCKDRT